MRGGKEPLMEGTTPRKDRLSDNLVVKMRHVSKYQLDSSLHGMGLGKPFPIWRLAAFEDNPFSWWPRGAVK
jgi:hypothetical protein